MKFYLTLKKVFGGLFTLLFRVHIVNAEKIPQDGGLIICGNHSSYLDPIVLGVAVKRHIRFMAKSELFKIKGLGWFIRKVGSFPVHRGENDLTAIKTALKILKNGEVLGLFPQGKRVSAEEAVDAKAGLAMFSYKTKASILPVGINYHPKAGLFRRTDIVFGDPIRYDDIDFKTAAKEDFLRVSSDIMGKIEALRTE